MPASILSLLLLVASSARARTLIECVDRATARVSLRVIFSGPRPTGAPGPGETDWRMWLRGELYPGAVARTLARRGPVGDIELILVERLSPSGFPTGRRFIFDALAGRPTLREFGLGRSAVVATHDCRLLSNACEAWLTEGAA